MNRRDAIRTIGDLITEIDVARSSLRVVPDVRLHLDDTRTLLNHRVIQLVQAPHVEISEQLEEELAKLEACKTQIVGGNLIDITNFLKNVDEFLGNRTDFLALALGGDTTTHDPGKKKT